MTILSRYAKQSKASANFCLTQAMKGVFPVVKSRALAIARDGWYRNIKLTGRFVIVIRDI